MDLVEKINRSVDKGIVDGMAEVWLTAEECKRIVTALDHGRMGLGHWVDYKDEHRCSICGEVIVSEPEDWDDGERYNYCPRCGVRMINK